MAMDNTTFDRASLRLPATPLLVGQVNLFLFDELFRGTNAIERIAAAEAVLREMVGPPEDRKPHVVLVATHDGELVELLRDTFVPYHFTDSLGTEGLTFQYRLEPGAATSWNAIALLQLQGAPARHPRADRSVATRLTGPQQRRRHHQLGQSATPANR